MYVTVGFVGDEEKWTGPADIGRQHHSVLVRIKAWRSSDLPPPTFKSRVINFEAGENNASNEAYNFTCVNTYLDLKKKRWTFKGDGTEYKCHMSNISRYTELKFFVILTKPFKESREDSG
jgi:hypothetical protein